MYVFLRMFCECANEPKYTSKNCDVIKKIPAEIFEKCIHTRKSLSSQNIRNAIYTYQTTILVLYVKLSLNFEKNSSTFLSMSASSKYLCVLMLCDSRKRQLAMSSLVITFREGPSRQKSRRLFITRLLLASGI